MQNNILKKSIKYIPYFILFLVCIYNFCYFYKNFHLFLDSDMASEMLLTKITLRDRVVLSKSWFYSTEVRILYNQLIYAPLFLIFSSWINIHVFGNFIMLLLMILSLWFMCKKLGLNNLFPYFGIVISLPFSSVYFDYTLLGSYYFHYIIMFVIIGLSCDIYNVTDVNKLKKRLPILIVYYVMSFVIGLSGVRYALILYIPLLLTFCELKIRQIISNDFNFENDELTKKLFFIVGGVVLFLIGLVLNMKVLPLHYTFYDFSTTKFCLLSLDKVIEQINGLLLSLGFISDAEIISIEGIISLFSVVLFVLPLVAYWLVNKRKQCLYSKILVNFTFFQLFVYLVLCATTTIIITPRYSLFIAVFFCFVAIVAIDFFEKKNHMKPYFKTLLIVLMISMSIFVYQDKLNQDKTSSLIKVKELLLQNNSKEGYATFWNSNILTELSDGAIETWTVTDDYTGFYYWLQDKGHMSRKPANNNFYLLSKSELENLNLQDDFEIQGYNKFVVDNYYVFIES